MGALAQSSGDIGFGDTVSDTLGLNENHTYQFAANGGDHIIIRMKTDWMNGPELKLLAPNGTMIAQAFYTSNPWDWTSDPCRSDIDTFVYGPGVYTIVAGDAEGDGAGNYTLYLQRADNPGNAISITPGQVAERSFDQTSTMDTYTFSASTGDTVLFHFLEINAPTNSAYSTELLLYAPNGSLAGYAQGGNGIPYCDLQHTFGESGTYTLLARDYKGFSVGSYSLSMQLTNNPAGVVPITFGETATGSIDKSSEMDTYSFSANAGDHVLVRTKTDWANGPQLLLYASDGSLVSSAAYTNDPWNWMTDPCRSDLDLIIGQSGTYYIMMRDPVGANTGNYALYLQRTDDPGNAIPITPGQVVRGSLDLTSTMDTYTFSASAGDTMLFHVLEINSPWYSNFNPELLLYAPDGTLVASAMGGRGIIYCDLAHTFGESGTYTLLARDYKGINVGNYALFMQSTNDPTGAQSIGFGETVTGSLDDYSDMGSYTFSANAGDHILTRMKGDWGNGPQLLLYAPNGSMVGSASFTNDPWNWLTDPTHCDLDIVLSESGTYALFARDPEGDSTGNYGIYLQRTNDPGNVVPTAAGQVMEGTFDTMAKMDAYSFTVDTGDTMLFHVLEVDRPWNSNFNPQLLLYAPNGSLVASAMGDRGIIYCDLAQRFEEPGVYTLLVRDYKGQDIGRYALSMQLTNDPAGARPLGYGETATGSLDHYSEMDSYTFSANAGDHILARMKGDWGNGPQLLLYAPNGCLVGMASYTNDPWNWMTDPTRCDLDIIVNDTGTYTLLARDPEGDGTGNYGIYLQRMNGPGNTTAIVAGQTAEGSLDTIAQMDPYMFTATEGDTALFHMFELDTPTNSAYNAELLLYAPNGSLVGSALGGRGVTYCDLQYTFGESGTYTLLARDYKGYNAGRYTLSMHRVYTHLSVATDATYPPFELYNASSDRLEGFDIDLMDQIGAELGCSVSYANIPFDTIIPEVAAGTYDCAISAFTIRPDRQQVIDFSDPYYQAGPEEYYGIVVNKANPDLTATINDALAKMKEDGRYQAIYDKWFPSSRVVNERTGMRYSSIQAAINDSNTMGGDTIRVESGTYYENVVVNKQLTLRGVDTGNGLPVVDGRGGSNVIMQLSVPDITMEYFVISNAGPGTGIQMSGHDTVRYNTVMNNNWGIWDSGEGNVVTANTIIGNQCGIIDLGATNGNITANNASYNLMGIFVIMSNGTVVDGNTICFNNMHVPSGQPGDMGSVGLAVLGCNGGAFRNNNISYNLGGFLLASGHGGSPDENFITENNIVENNTITYNAGGPGGSGGTSIGLLVSAADNIVRDNDISYNDVGVILSSSPDTSYRYGANDLISNTIEHNNLYGIGIQSSNDNTICLNDFADNGYGVFVQNATNSWNTPTEETYRYGNGIFVSYLGNHWGDYSGNDWNGDGIGEMSYSWNGAVDQYPLVAPVADYNTSVGVPVARFSADVTHGDTPLVVSFTDMSTNNPTSWLWNFGDGSMSLVKDPVHTYQVGGFYNVTLTVSNGHGTDNETKYNYIIVVPTQGPVVNPPTPGVEFSIPLNKGWNLVSSPVEPNDGSLDSVFEGIKDNIVVVWAYDSNDASQPWRYYVPYRSDNTLTAIDETMGVWVLCDKDTVLTFKGQPVYKARVNVNNESWNLIGHPFLDSSSPAEQYSSSIAVWGYQNDGWYLYTTIPGYTCTLTELRPGYGYWVLPTYE